jgi:hypothetical protein
MDLADFTLTAGSCAPTVNRVGEIPRLCDDTLHNQKPIPAGAWQTPTLILPARFAKITKQLDLLKTDR